MKIIILSVLILLVATLCHADTATDTLKEKIASVAASYDVSGNLMMEVIKCESSYNPNAIGDHGTSLGLVQIHLPAHPDITRAEAFDPIFAINFMAAQFAKHNENIWSCYSHVKDV